MRKTIKVTAELTRDEAMNLGSHVPSNAENLTLTQKKDKFLLKYDQVEGEPMKSEAAPIAAAMKVDAMKSDPGVAEAEAKLDAVKNPKKP